jgi:peroxidase
MKEDPQTGVPPSSQIPQDKDILGNKAKTLSTGDVRGNDNPILMVFQILFLREHNFQARRIKKRSPSLDDETVFQEARRMVIALYQHIAYDEYLPTLLGHSLPAFKGYDKAINPNPENFFVSVAYRFAHANVLNSFPLVDRFLEPTEGEFKMDVTMYVYIIKFDGCFDIKTLAEISF